MDRRKFLRATLAATTLPTPSTSSPSREQPAFQLDEWSVSDLQRRIASGELTSVKITELYLRRIESLDQEGPTLRSVIETNPDALAIARSLDEEYRAKGA
jgi:amidase